MDSQDVFIILGLALTVLALIISAIGVKAERFPPSKGALLAGIGLFAVLIGFTMVFAWNAGEEEQEHRNELRASGEEPTPAEVMDELLAATEETRLEAQGGAVAAGEDEGAPDAGTEQASADGAAIFEEQGCAGCHALAAAGSTGTTGPDLDVELDDADAQFVEESIVDPEAEIAEGYPGGVMPSNYGEELSPEELQALVDYILESVQGQAQN
jgi:mono/diheme cytochrome c family protein